MLLNTHTSANSIQTCEDYLLRSISSLCLRRGCTYVALKESVISNEGRLMLSNVQPLRCLEQRNSVKYVINRNPSSYECFVCSHISLLWLKSTA